MRRRSLGLGSVRNSHVTVQKFTKSTRGFGTLVPNRESPVVVRRRGTTLSTPDSHVQTQVKRGKLSSERHPTPPLTPTYLGGDSSGSFLRPSSTGFCLEDGRGETKNKNKRVHDSAVGRPTRRGRTEGVRDITPRAQSSDWIANPLTRRRPVFSTPERTQSFFSVRDRTTDPVGPGV